MVSDFPSFDVAAFEVRVRFRPAPDHALRPVALLVVLILEAGMLSVRPLFGDVQFTMFAGIVLAMFMHLRFFNRIAVGIVAESGAFSA